MSEQQPPAIEKQWHYEKNGARQNAITESALKALLRSGQLNSQTLVWCTGMSAWQTAEQAGLVAPPPADQPPPLSGNQVNNNIVWVLAFAPVIALFLEYLFAMVRYDNEFMASMAVSSMEFFYIPLVLNLLLSFLDERKLRQAGHDTSHFKGWVWLVPVYLFQRAEHLRQPKYYFATWIVCILISCFR